MMPASLGTDLKYVLAVGAHCDDVEIGCFGTLAAIAAASPDVRIRIVLFASDETREREARDAIAAISPLGRTPELTVHRFRDGYFPGQWAALKECFDKLGREGSPDLIFTHAGSDAHQDHRVVSELTWNTFRSHLILEYEIPKYDGDLGRPSVFVPLAKEAVERKVAAVLHAYTSQRGRAWFTADLFRGLMRVRGMECASPSGFAEAFYCRKLVLGFGL